MILLPMLDLSVCKYHTCCIRINHKEVVPSTPRLICKEDQIRQQSTTNPKDGLNLQAGGDFRSYLSIPVVSALRMQNTYMML